MTQIVQPRIRVTPEDVDVTPGKPFVLQVKIKNTTEIIDAFEISVLGVDRDQVHVEPELVSLFPDTDETLMVEVTLPDDFPVDRSELWVKVTSCTDPVVYAMETVAIRVASITAGTIAIDPAKAEGRRSGRFGVTLHNAGNAPTDLLLVGSDDENHFTFRFDRDRVRLAPGATTSVQAVVSGRRPITGATVPRPFTITAEASGFQMSDAAMLEQKPRIPSLALMLAAVLALLGLWAVVVGAAIDKVIDDSDGDLASSFEDGVGSVVDGLDADQAAEAALDEAQAGVLASRAGADDGTAGAGIEVGSDAGDGEDGSGSGDDAGADGSANGSTDGQAGGAGATTPVDEGGPIEVIDPTRPTIDVPPDVLAGYVVAASDAVASQDSAPRPVPGASITIQALLEAAALPDEIDPNRDPVSVVADEAGIFESPNLVAGTYAVTFSSVGYVDVVCPAVTIPTAAGSPPLGGCAAGARGILPGASSIVGVPGDTASIAGVATLEDDPVAGVEIFVRRLDQTTGAPSVVPVRVPTGAPGEPPDDPPADPPAAPLATATTEEDGRFSFVLDADGPPTTPGAFEIVFVVDDDVAARQVVPLEAGEHVVGLQVPIAPMTANEVRSVSGTIRGEDTEAGIPSATVTITGVGGSWEITTLGDGTYGLDDLPAGTYNVSASAPGYLPGAGEATVPTAEGEPAVVDLVLAADPDRSRLPASIRSISGTVTSPAGPVPNATVTITSADGTWTVATLANGTYRLEDLQPGLHNVSVSAAGFTSAATQVTVPGAIDDEPAVADFVLAPAAPTVPASVRSISGTVRGPDGPIASATVTITGPSGTSTLSTLVDGTYRREDLLPGLYNIAVSSPLYEPQAQQRTVSGEVDGSPAVADFLLARRRTTISGSVSSTNRPAGFVATIRDGAGNVVARTDPAGNWATDATFTAGELTLRVEAGDHVTETRTVTVDPARPPTLVVELIRVDDWNPGIGTPITTNLLAPTLMCVEGPGGPVFAPTSAAPAVTQAVWTPPPGSSASPSVVDAEIVTAVDGRTSVQITRVPNRGTLRLTLGGGPPGLFGSQIDGIDLRTRPPALTLAFLGAGGVFSDAEVALTALGVGNGAPCPTVFDLPNPRTPVRRTFVLGELGSETSVLLVNQLTNAASATISSGGSSWSAGTGDPAPWYRLTPSGA